MIRPIIYFIKNNFFFLFFFFIFLLPPPPQVFSHQVEGEMEKYLKNSVLFILFFLPHISLVFFTKERGGMVNFYIFSPPITYFLISIVF